MQNRFVRILFAAVLSISLTGCISKEFSVSAPVSFKLRSITVKLSGSDEVTLKDAGLRLKLLEVNDSRCPQGVQCFWAGEVGITLEIAKIGVQYVRQPLYTLFDSYARSEPKSVLVEGYKFKILEVTPAPVQGEVQNKVVTLELIPDDR